MTTATARALIARVADPNVCTDKLHRELADTLADTLEQNRILRGAIFTTMHAEIEDTK